MPKKNPAKVPTPAEVVISARSMVDLLPSRYQGKVRELIKSPALLSNQTEIAIISLMIVETMEKMSEVEVPAYQKMARAIGDARKIGKDSISVAELERYLVAGYEEMSTRNDAKSLISLANQLRMGEVSITKTMQDMMAAPEVYELFSQIKMIISEELSDPQFNQVRERIARRFEAINS